MRPIGVLYENEAWLEPLFAALDRAGLPYERCFAPDATFDPAGPAPLWSLAVNKVSPSSYLRAHAPAIAFARAYLPFLERSGIPVVNGSAAFALETSKWEQLRLLERLGIRAPRAARVTDSRRVAEAAGALRFPVIVKPNVGGSGALMRRFATPVELAAATDIDLGPGGTGIVQEYLETGDGAITRVEFLDGEQLYAIKITNTSEQDFNLCPADICSVEGAPSLQTPATFDNCVTGAPAKKALRIEAVDAPAEMTRAVLRIATAGQLDVGGVEYLVAARDGLAYVYDINALSNFVTDAETVVGFDPHARFARWLGARARADQAVAAAK
jgi:hypothetical protein